MKIKHLTKALGMTAMQVGKVLIWIVVYTAYFGTCFIASAFLVLRTTTTTNANEAMGLSLALTIVLSMAGMALILSLLGNYSKVKDGDRL